jgi:hypothetical protein
MGSKQALALGNNRKYIDAISLTFIIRPMHSTFNPENGRAYKAVGESTTRELESGMNLY